MTKFNVVEVTKVGATHVWSICSHGINLTSAVSPGANYLDTLNFEYAKMFIYIHIIYTPVMSWQRHTIYTIACPLVPKRVIWLHIRPMHVSRM